MSYYTHHAIIVTGFTDKAIQDVHKKATEIFAKHLGEHGADLITPVVKSATNGFVSFFIAPDGSKEGWDTSDKGDLARKEYLDWLNTERRFYIDYVEVAYADEHKEGAARDTIVRSNELDLGALPGFVETLQKEFERNKPYNFKEVVSKYPESTSPEITVGKGWRQLLDEMSDEEKAKYTWKTGEELLNRKRLNNGK